jgi:transposase
VDTTILPADSAEVAALKQVLQKERQEFQRELAWAKLKNEALEARLRKLLLAKYGPSSEKLSDDQLRLLEFEPGVSSEEVKAESERGQEELQHRPKRKREAKAHPGRQTLPENLPRVEEIVEVPAAQCVCDACQKEMTVIGYEESEQLDVKPAEYFVRVTKREKRACSACGKGGVKTAPVAPSIVEKSLVSDRIVVETVIAKYLDHLPLYRQSAMLARDAGIEIHRSTMCGWVMRVGELLLPIAEAMRRELLARNYIQADETPIEVQMHDGRGKNHQAYLWQYSAPFDGSPGGMGPGGMDGGGIVLFDFQMGRGREAPKRMLRDFAGILQTDGYAAYDKVGAAGIVHAACWAHARRKFVEALKLNTKDAEAARIVARMDALFAIDAEARDAVMSIEQRHALRLSKAAPLVAALREELLRLQKSTLPKSATGQAVNYTLSLWPRLTVFLAHPVVELSNNLAENSMRGVALGRKNWIHLGSANAGPKVAAILSIAETCRRRGIPLRDYLLDVLPGMADRKRSEVAGLTPTRWKATRT